MRRCGLSHAAQVVGAIIADHYMCIGGDAKETGQSVHDVQRNNRRGRTMVVARHNNGAQCGAACGSAQGVEPSSQGMRNKKRATRRKLRSSPPRARIVDVRHLAAQKLGTGPMCAGKYE